MAYYSPVIFFIPFNTILYINNGINQLIVVIVDNTNANKETLSVLKSIKNSALLTNTQKETKGNYVRDGIEFKTKEDLEAYFATMEKNS